MKKTFVIIAWVLSLLMGEAYAASLNIGYCHGQIAEDGISKVGNACIEGAIILPPEILAEYTDATITGVRIGLVTEEGISNLCGWIRKDLREENLDCSNVINPIAGWNEVVLEGGLKIDGTQLVVGFSFNQEKGIKCISVTGEDNENAKWIAKNGNWSLANSKGALSIELVITSEQLPDQYLALVKVKSERMPVAAGEPMLFEAVVRNVALQPVDNFAIDCSIDGESVQQISSTATLQYGNQAILDFSVPTENISPDVIHNLEIKIIYPEDERSNNDVVALPVATFTETVPRQVLIEEFTSEQCVNCPRAFTTINQCIAVGYGEKIVVVAHHVGYKPDWLTLPEDNEYLWFYNPDGNSNTYAPAGMLDRTIFENYNVPVMSAINNFKEFEPLLKIASEQPAFVEVGIDPQYNDSQNTMEIGINVHRLPLFPSISNAARLTVYVLEDGIPHRAQLGIEVEDFTHSHVLRKFVTNVWGEPIDWNGDEAHFDFSVPIEESWEPDNLSIVAFVHDYDNSDISNCKVHNCAGKTLITSGVSSAVAEAIETETYWTLSGMKITNPQKGIFIRQTVLSDGSIRTSKIILP